MPPEETPDRAFADSTLGRAPSNESPTLLVGRVSLVVLIATIFLPTDGTGLDLCCFHRFTGLPCPGGGMTRGITSISHGAFESAWAYHPLAFAVYPLAFGLAIGAVVPPFRRGVLDPFFDRHPDVQNRAIVWGLIGLAAFGAVRIVFGDWWL